MVVEKKTEIGKMCRIVGIVIAIRPLIVKNEFVIRDVPLINAGGRAITIIDYFKFKLEVSFSLSVNI